MKPTFSKYYERHFDEKSPLNGYATKRELVEATFGEKATTAPPHLDEFLQELSTVLDFRYQVAKVREYFENVFWHSFPRHDPWKASIIDEKIKFQIGVSFDGIWDTVLECDKILKQ